MGKQVERDAKDSRKEENLDRNSQASVQHDYQNQQDLASLCVRRIQDRVKIP